MSLFVKFIAFFAILGLIISLAFGYVAGNRWVAIISTAIFCTLVSAVLGGGTFKVLELKVPEFLALFSGEADDESEMGYDEGALEGELGGEMGGEATYESDGMYGEAAAAASGDAQVFGDHILINNITLKNEPKIMAAAIRTMLAKDDES